MGQASSMASLILAAGEPGYRFSLKNGSVMIHQPSSGSGGGQAADISIQATEILRVRQRMFELYADHCSGATESRHDAIARFSTLLSPYMSPLADSVCDSQAPRSGSLSYP